MANTMTNDNCCEVSYDTVRQAMNGEPHEMNLVGAAAKYVKAAVNQGIDSHLEACFCPTRGDSFEWYHELSRKLHCVVSVESLPVLLRRLFEMDPDDEDASDTPGSLASGILRSLGINDKGELVGREALGLD